MPTDAPTRTCPQGPHAHGIVWACCPAADVTAAQAEARR